MSFDKKQFCKQLKDSQEGLHLLDEVVDKIKHVMLSYERNSIQITREHLGIESRLYWCLFNYPKLTEELTKLGFSVERKSFRHISHYKKIKTKSGRKFLFFDLYEHKIEPVYKEEDDLFIISICCGEENV